MHHYIVVYYQIYAVLLVFHAMFHMRYAYANIRGFALFIMHGICQIVLVEDMRKKHLPQSPDASIAYALVNIQQMPQTLASHVLMEQMQVYAPHS